MEVIQQWLDGPRNYRLGRLLYNTYGEDAELKVLFKDGPTHWNINKLEQCLAELASGTKPKELNDEYSSMPAGGDDAILQALHAEWEVPYKVMQYKIRELDKYEGGDARQEAIRRTLAHEVLSLERQCMAIWKKRDFYKEHGHLPELSEATPPVLTDPIDIATRISNLERYIRRHKNNASKHPDNPKYPALVKQYELELYTLTQHDQQTTSTGEQ